MRIKDISIKTRLHCVFILTVIMFISAMLIAVRGLYQIGDEAELLSRPRQDTILLSAALNHQKWAIAVQTFVTDAGAQPLNVPTDGKQCDFGKWFYAGGRSEIEAMLPEIKSILQRIDTEHLQLHAAAQSIQTAIAQRDTTLATDILHNTIRPLLHSLDSNFETGRALASQSQTDTLSKLQGYLATDVKLIGALAILFTLIAATLVTAIINGITTPLTRLGEVAGNVSRGIFAPVDIHQNDEIGHLANAFNIMVHDIKERIGILQGLTNNMTSAFAMFDTQDRITFINDEMLHNWGRSGKPADYIGKSSGYFFNNDDNKSTLISRVLNDPKSIIKHTLSRKNFKNEQKHFNIDVAPLHNLDGRLVGAFTLHNDLTQMQTQQDRICILNDRIFTSANKAREISANQENIFEELFKQLETTSQLADEQRSSTIRAAEIIRNASEAMLEMAHMASLSRENMHQTETYATEGASLVGQTLQGMASMAEQAQKVSSCMKDLDVHTSGIGNILDLIKDVADQTNLLALNAAIEAARAGEAGRGFAVVADEVRKLAEKTMQATGEVSKAVNSIQCGVRESNDATTQAVDLAQKTTELAQASSESLKHIQHMTHIASEDITQIAKITERQAGASQDVLQTVERISEQAQVTTSSMGSSTAHGATLRGLSGELKTIIEAMRTERRHDQRYALHEPYGVTLTTYTGSQLNAKLLDICSTGARLQLSYSKALAVGDTVSLTGAEPPFNQILTERVATVRWVDGVLAGMQFTISCTEDIAKLSEGYAEEL